jgi:hypothetical protein
MGCRRYFHSDLLKAVEEHMHRHLVNLPPRQLARLILSFARLNYSPRPALLQVGLRTRLLCNEEWCLDTLTLK